MYFLIIYRDIVLSLNTTKFTGSTLFIMNHQKYNSKNCDIPYTSFQNMIDRPAYSNKSTNNVAMKTFKNREDLEDLDFSIENDHTSMSISIHPDMTKYPTIANCITCNATIETIVDRRINGRGWTWAIFCIFGCFLLSFLTTCLDSFNDWIHICPNCKGIIGKYSNSYRSKKEIIIIVIASLIGVAGFAGLIIGVIYIVMISGWIHFQKNLPMGG